MRDLPHLPSLKKATLLGTIGGIGIFWLSPYLVVFQVHGETFLSKPSLSISLVPPLSGKEVIAEEAREEGIFLIQSPSLDEEEWLEQAPLGEPGVTIPELRSALEPSFEHLTPQSSPSGHLLAIDREADLLLLEKISLFPSLFQESQ